MEFEKYIDRSMEQIQTSIKDLRQVSKTTLAGIEKKMDTGFLDLKSAIKELDGELKRLDSSMHENTVGIRIHEEYISVMREDLKNLANKIRESQDKYQEIEHELMIIENDNKSLIEIKRELKSNDKDISKILTIDEFKKYNTKFVFSLIGALSTVIATTIVIVNLIK